MQNPTVSLKPINDLLAESFFIPSYQRGYRWTPVQVEDLLNDLWEFQTQSHMMDPSSFYCLQPLVIKSREDGSWEVVDGQQRLTTIFLILACLRSVVEMLGKSPFQLSFETRTETSEAFLKDIDPAKANENIDFYHISKAYEAIQNWMNNRDSTHRFEILQTLLKDDKAGRNVKVIWYELPHSENSIEAFTRLNIGKIPLTNAELIRALFLRSENFSEDTRDLQQLRIAQEWDLIEKTLQSPDFWYFIHSGQNPPASRIEYLFDLIVEEDQDDHTQVGDPYRSFHHYNALLKTPDVKPTDEWLKLKQFFMMVEEWFRDRSLYHLTGFLIHLGVPVGEMRKEALRLPKSEFDRAIRLRIFEELFGQGGGTENGGSLAERLSQQLGDMEYGRSSVKLRSVLLLFNIATLLENERSNLRFPFDSFKREKWDIEHISSVDSEKPDRPDTQKQWLQGVKECYREIDGIEELEEKIDAVLESRPFNKGEFNEIYEQILKHYGEEETSEADHQIGNLTLLDQATNRSYQNAVFPVKRHRILDLDRSGTFVPLCTRNIFLKCYSQKLDDMLRWNDGDKEDYEGQIVGILSGFFENCEPQAPGTDEL